MITTNLTPKRGLILLFVLFAVFPIVINDAYLHHLFILSFLFGIFVCSWNLLFGFMGIYSFGHQAFFGVGAYVSGLMAVRLGLSPWLGLLAGGLGAALISLILSWLTFRLKGPYVSIITLAFAEVLRITCSNWVDLTRGQLGLTVPPIFHGSRLQYYNLVFLLFTVTIIVLIKLIHSSFGLVVTSIRESQEAAESLGIDLLKYKQLTFVITSFMAGVAGAFYGHYMGILTPDVMGIQVMFSILVMGLFGGIGTTLGPALGAFFLTFLAEFLRALEKYRYLIYSLVIIFTVLFLPRGLAGGLKDLKSLLRRKFRFTSL